MSTRSFLRSSLWLSLVVAFACANRDVAAPAPAGAATHPAAGADPAPAVATLDANGTTVSVAAGRTLTLRLRNLGDGGYQAWALSASPDAAVLRLASSAHEAPGPGAPLGNFGQDLFVFQALAPGQTRLVATATRPWKGGETETFTLSVTVR
jgi:predicted secreted protein